MAKKTEPRRAIKITFQNGETSYIEIVRAVEIALTNGKEFVYLDKKVNGNWMLTYTKGMIPEDTKVETIEIIREDSDQSLTSAHLRTISNSHDS